MKQKDIILLIVVAFISGVLAILATKFFIAPPKKRQQKVEVVEAINADFKEPDKKYFNPSAINPTKVIQIGPSDNQDPINKQQ